MNGIPMSDASKEKNMREPDPNQLPPPWLGWLLIAMFIGTAIIFPIILITCTR